VQPATEPGALDSSALVILAPFLELIALALWVCGRSKHKLSSSASRGGGTVYRAASKESCAEQPNR